MALSVNVSGGSSAPALMRTPISSANFAAVQPTISKIQNIANSNYAASASEAAKLRDWQEDQNQKAMNFNAAEAAKNRDWQKMMSDTAHQREILDLKAAGLNPVLSALNGNGASVGSGATASGVTSSGAMGSPDTTQSGALVSLLGSVLNAQMQMNAMNVSAMTNLAIADKNNAMSELVARIHAAGSAGAARIAADAAMERQQQQQHWEENNPNNPYRLGSSIFNKIFGSGNNGSSNSGKGSLESWADEALKVLVSPSSFASSVDKFFNTSSGSKKYYDYYKSQGYYD